MFSLSRAPRNKVHPLPLRATAICLSPAPARARPLEPVGAPLPGRERPKLAGIRASSPPREVRAGAAAPPLQPPATWVMGQATTCPPPQRLLAVPDPVPGPLPEANCSCPHESWVRSQPLGVLQTEKLPKSLTALAGTSRGPVGRSGELALPWALWVVVVAGPP